MENLRSKIKEKILPAIALDGRYSLTNKSYKIIEECDMYGFSCLKSMREESPEQQNFPNLPSDIFEAFRRDENWFNPSALELMMKSYQIDEPYGSFLRPPQDELSVRNYLSIKSKQNSLLSAKILDEGMVLLQNSRIADAIKKFTAAISQDENNSEAFFARANAYFRLHDWSYALVDATKAVELNPSCQASNQLLKAIQSYIPVSADRKQDIGTTVVPQNSDVELIRRLKASLIQESRSDQSRDETNSSLSSDTDNHKKSKKKHSKKRKKKHKKDNKSKRRRSDSSRST